MSLQAQHGEDLAFFDSSLKGQTILPKPHVTKEVIVAALQCQNRVLQDLTKELTNSRAQIASLQAQVESIETRTDTQNVTAAQQAQINELQTAFDECRGENQSALGPQAQIKVLTSEIREVQSSISSFDETTKYRVQSLEDRMRTMPGTMQVSMSQIVMDDDTTQPHMADCPRKTFLQEFHALRTMVDTHDYDLASFRRQSQTEIVQQASVLNDMRGRVGRLESFSEKVQGMQQVIHLSTEALEDIKVILKAKADLIEVDQKLEQKFQDTVQQLMRALKTVQDDEEEFRRTTADLHTALYDLKTEKADRSELSFVRERIQKLSEDTPQLDVELLDSLQKRVTRDEVKMLLEEKANREDLVRATMELKRSLVRQTNRLRSIPGEAMGMMLPTSATHGDLRPSGGQGGKPLSVRSSRAGSSRFGGLFSPAAFPGPRLSTPAGIKEDMLDPDRGELGAKSQVIGKDGLGEGLSPEESKVSGVASKGRDISDFVSDMQDSYEHIGPMAWADLEQHPAVQQIQRLMSSPQQGQRQSRQGRSITEKVLLWPGPPAPEGLAFVQQLRPRALSPSNPAPATKICLACHSEIPNAPKEKLYAEGSYGGGYQLLVPASAADRGPQLRTCVSEASSAPTQPAAGTDHATDMQRSPSRKVKSASQPVIVSL